MGCWNGSCGLTGLPIFAGDEVVVFTLIQQRPQGDHCYPETYWQPLIYTFDAQYDDYGGADECKGPLLERILEVIRDNLVELDIGENKYHDIAVKKTDFDVSKYFEAAHESRLFVAHDWKTNDAFKTLSVFPLMVHKSVVKQLLEQYKVDDWRKGRYGYGEIVEDGYQYVTGLQQVLAKDITLNGRSDIPLRLKLTLISDNEDAYSRFTDLQHVFRLPDYIRYVDDMSKAVESGNIDLANAIVEQVAQMAIIKAYMQSSRRMWTPMSGAGSQDGSTKAHRLMAEITVTKATEIDEQWGDEEDDLDE